MSELILRLDFELVAKKVHTYILKLGLLKLSNKALGSWSLEALQVKLNCIHWYNICVRHLDSTWCK